MKKKIKTFYFKTEYKQTRILQKVVHRNLDTHLAKPIGRGTFFWLTFFLAKVCRSFVVWVPLSIHPVSAEQGNESNKSDIDFHRFGGSQKSNQGSKRALVVQLFTLGKVPGSLAEKSALKDAQFSQSLRVKDP